MRRATRRRLRRIALTLLVVVPLLVAAELAARSADIPDPRATPRDAPDGAILLDGNPWLLWELVPGTRREQGALVHVSSAGFRGPERGPRTVPRALALGDSSIYGFGVGEDEVFTALLEGDGRRAEHVNGGVPGYSSFQALNLLEMRGLALEPDLLLIGTLWSDNNFDSFTDRDLIASFAGWEGSWQRDARVALERLAVFRWLDWTLRVGPTSERARKVGWQVGGADPRSGYRRVAINDYASNLDRLCRTMRARGGGVVFLQLANRPDIEVNAPDTAWAPYREVMADVAAHWGAPLVVVPEVYRASGRSADALFLDQMHPTALGHRLLAEGVAAVLDARGWPERPLELQAPKDALGRYVDPYEGTGREGGPPRTER